MSVVSFGHPSKCCHTRKLCGKRMHQHVEIILPRLALHRHLILSICFLFSLLLQLFARVTHFVCLSWITRMIGKACRCWDSGAWSTCQGAKKRAAPPSCVCGTMLEADLVAQDDELRQRRRMLSKGPWSCATSERERESIYATDCNLLHEREVISRLRRVG